MNFTELFKDKNIKGKEKTEQIAHWLMDNPEQLKKLIDFAGKAKDAEKATCIEAIELATRAQPEIVDEECIKFVSKSLGDKAPRIKWESARVIGNTAHLHTTKLETAIKNLLNNSEHIGTVVRWSAAYALGEIVKQKTKHQKDLIAAIEAIIEREEKNSIKKIYLTALKKIK